MLYFTATEFRFVLDHLFVLDAALNAGKNREKRFLGFQPEIPAFKAGLGRIEK